MFFRGGGGSEEEAEGGREYWEETTVKNSNFSVLPGMVWEQGILINSWFLLTFFLSILPNNIIILDMTKSLFIIQLVPN